MNCNQVFNERFVIQLALSRVGRTQDRRRVDCSGDSVRRRTRKESAALLKKAVVRPDDRAGSRGAQTNDQLRPDDGEFGLEPGFAGSDLGGRRSLVNSPLAALLELKVLHGVGEVDVRTFDSRLIEGAVEKRPRRANEGTSGQILFIARLLSDHHNAGGGRTFSENRLRGGAV